MHRSRSIVPVAMSAVGSCSCMAIIALYPILVLTTFLLSTATANNSTEVERTVSNWRRAETLTKQCSGELSWITTWNAPSDNAGRPPRRVEYTYKITEPDVLQQIVFDEDQGRDEQIVGINRDYGFRLRRKGEASAWELQYVGTNTEPLWRAFERDGKVCALYWLYIDGKYLLDLFKNPAFHIQSVSDDSSGVSTLIRFTCDDIPHVNQTWWVREGTIVVKKDSLSTVSKVELTCRQDGKDFTSVQENEFAVDPNDIPYLVKYTYKSSTGVTQERAYRNVAFGPVPRDQFYLEAYGLKFGGLEAPSRFSPFLIINIIAIAVIATALAIRRLRTDAPQGGIRE